MSIRNLDALFDPDSVAVFGASLRAGSVGATVWHNLSSGHYKGELWGVNPKYSELSGRLVVAHARDLPAPPAFWSALFAALSLMGTS